MRMVISLIPLKEELDLQNKIFKHTSPAFEEDPLQSLRFARFKSYEQLHDFDLHEETEVLFEKIVASTELKDLSLKEYGWKLKKLLKTSLVDQFFKL